MNASNAFRSHLMQQFAAAARTQSRPPLALVSWLTDEESSCLPTNMIAASDELAVVVQPPPPHHPWLKNTTTTTTQPTSSSDSIVRQSRQSIVRHFSSGIPVSSVAEEDSIPVSLSEEENDNNNDDTPVLAHQFQTLIQTRRTTSHFETYDSRDVDYWKNVLDRAVSCGIRSPNHKRTEPLFFKRMIAPSTATQRLAEIAYQKALVKSQQKAEKKRAKWNAIPSFLVTLVRSSNNIYDPQTTFQVGPYEELPFVPLKTEREMEDYATACAAIENILLSLHAENVASKWATGPVIQTPAFRDLVGASPQDRVVGLIMIGFATNTKFTNRPRRLRRDLDQVMQDL